MNKNLHSFPAFPAVSALSFCIACTLLAGCVSGPESHVVSAPPPSAQPSTMTTTTTTTTPTVVVNGQAFATAPAVSTVVVTQAPPAIQQEVAQSRPSSAHVWIAGYWTWRNERYEWMAGHWELAPRSGAVWVAPRWERKGGSYTFYEGYWN